MTTWNATIKKVLLTLQQLSDDGCPDPFFRGHSDSSWVLSPLLARRFVDQNAENRLYWNFKTLGGHLFQGASAWDTLLLMQHHGIPTRLLDWSESFAVALYFAMKAAEGNSAVWIMNPYALNSRSINSESVENLESDFPEGYDAYFLEQARSSQLKFPGPVVAIAAHRVDPRMQWQRAVYTLHANLEKPLEQIFPEAVTKVEIPASLHANARDFLTLAGMNEASVFPDLDGIARHLCQAEL